MKISTIPMLKDNYGYLIYDEYLKIAAVVDPVEPATVLAAADAVGCKLTHILTTHDHWDHAGGNEELVKQCEADRGWKLEVIGGSEDSVPALSKAVRHGDVFDLSPNIRVTALHTPFHTRGHICYAVRTKESSAEEGEGGAGEDGSGAATGGAVGDEEAKPEGEAAGADDGSSKPAAGTDSVDLFTGDSLFVCGCGRVNKGGSPEELAHSLLGVIAQAGPPSSTRVWVGHEYTEANVRFATAVEPGNKALQERAEAVATARKEGKPTVPSTLAQELATNPFLRPRSAAVRKFVGAKEGATDVEVVAALRRAKDSFGMGASAGGSKGT